MDQIGMVNNLANHSALLWVI